MTRIARFRNSITHKDLNVALILEAEVERRGALG